MPSQLDTQATECRFSDRVLLGGTRANAWTFRAGRTLTCFGSPAAARNANSTQQLHTGLSIEPFRIRLKYTSDGMLIPSDGPLHHVLERQLRAEGEVLDEHQASCRQQAGEVGDEITGLPGVGHVGVGVGQAVGRAQAGEFTPAFQFHRHSVLPLLVVPPFAMLAHGFPVVQKLRSLGAAAGWPNRRCPVAVVASPEGTRLGNGHRENR